MNPTSHKFNIFYLFLCIIWRPLQMYYLHVDGAGRTVLALSVLAIVWNFQAFWREADALRSPAFLCWMALVAFSIVNSMVKGFESEFGALSFFKTNYIVPFTFLYVLVLELSNDVGTTLKTLFYALLTYVLLGLANIINLSGMSFGFDERMAAEGLENLLPLHATCLVFVVGILNSRQRLSNTVLWAVVILAFVVSLLSGTRKAFGAIIILLVGIMLHNGQTDGRSIGYYLRLALFFAVLYWGLGFVMDHTMIGERLAGTAEQSSAELTGNESANAILNTLLGDRAIMYEMGFAVFLTSPWTGIGITNFMPVTGYPLRLHTEYMVQLCENGIIGFSLFMLFFYLLIKKLLKRRRMGEDIMLMMFGLFAVMFLNLTAWTYCTTFGMIYYGIIIAYAYSDSNWLEDEEDDEMEDVEDIEDQTLILEQ